MEKPFLNDPNEYPDDDVLSRALGVTKTVWDSFQSYLKENHPAFSGEWRFYKDGYAWLYKLTNKKKTISWISVWPGEFKTTFYFADKAEEPIKSSGLSPELINSFVNGKHYGKIRGITVEVTHASDLEATKILIGIKEKLK